MEDSLTLATIALAGVTFILVVITFFYMLFTAKIAKRMKDQTELSQKEFNVRITPRPEPDVGPHITSGSECDLTIKVFNAGLSPFFIDCIHLNFYHSDRPGEVHRETMQIKRYIQPGREYLREFAKFDYAQFPNFSEVEMVQGKAYITYHVELFDLLNERYRWPKEGEVTKQL